MVLDNGRYISSEMGNITQMLEEHFRTALSINKMVVNAVSEWLEEGKVLEQDTLTKLTELEVKGDQLKRKILHELANATTLMQREDLLRLVHYNDKLIDGAEIAGYHLAAMMDKWAPTGALRAKVIELGKLFISEIKEQREAVRFLSINMVESMKRADAICNIEKALDVLQREILTLLYSEKIDLAILLRFRDFLNTIEELANLGEDAAITIRSLSLTLNS
ncbi:MAG: hypothetical protein BAJATHORv1_50025 [Candidatus Thorarchaeota archaeon]|nr:MAG: hypothetical protein BAJATHORv1_50025 [Candidatus Thorarchaeota archaeon]